MKYIYLNGLPVLDQNHSCYYQINDFRIDKFENGRIVENWQTSPNEFEKSVFQWAGNFWNDLQNAPQFEIDANQWTSNYYSLFDGRVFHWSDDRHENCYILFRSYDPGKFLADATIAELYKNWLMQLLTEK